jgi:hypothetical protein
VTFQGPCRPSPENKPINGFQGPLPLAGIQGAEPLGRGLGAKPRSSRFERLRRRAPRGSAVIGLSSTPPSCRRDRRSDVQGTGGNVGKLYTTRSHRLRPGRRDRAPRTRLDETNPGRLRPGGGPISWNMFRHSTGATARYLSGFLTVSGHNGVLYWVTFCFHNIHDGGIKIAAALLGHPRRHPGSPIRNIGFQSGTLA